MEKPYLNTFNHKIDYAHAEVSTCYGISGVREKFTNGPELIGG